LGEVYRDPKVIGPEGLVSDDLAVLIEALDHDLERRRATWRRAKQQEIIDYIPPVNLQIQRS
jgi:hypothetical protein